jgi:hypothetical protein
VVAVPSGPGIAAGEYWWERFDVEGGPGGRTVALRFSNAEGVYWKLLALVVKAR